MLILISLVNTPNAYLFLLFFKFLIRALHRSQSLNAGEHARCKDWFIGYQILKRIRLPTTTIKKITKKKRVKRLKWQWKMRVVWQGPTSKVTKRCSRRTRQDSYIKGLVKLLKHAFRLFAVYCECAFVWVCVVIIVVIFVFTL